MSQEFRSIATAEVEYRYKTLDYGFVLLLGGNSMLRMETTDYASPTDAVQKTFYSNNPQKLLVYEALFENCWMLPMVHETISISQKAVKDIKCLLPSWYYPSKRLYNHLIGKYKVDSATSQANHSIPLSLLRLYLYHIFSNNILTGG